MFSLKYSPFVLCAMVRYDNSHMILMKEIITMKKLTAMALVLAMVLSLSSCGKSDGDSSAADNSKAETSASDTSAADEGSESETEAETEPETEADPNADMVKLDCGEGFHGYNAYIYIHSGNFSESYSSYKDGATVHYDNDDPAYSIYMTLNIVEEHSKTSRLASTGYEPFTGNQNGYESSIMKYDEERAQAGYYLYADGPDGSFVELCIDINSLYNMDEAAIIEIIDTIGKTATIEGSYEDTASSGADDGALVSESGYLSVPAEMTIKGVTAAAEKEASGNMSIKAVTSEIDGDTYTITELGTVNQANYDSLLAGTFVKDNFGAETTIAGYTTARLVYVNSGYVSAVYFVKINDDVILNIKVANSKMDFAAAKQRVNDNADETNALYDEIVSDYLSAVTINVE